MDSLRFDAETFEKFVFHINGMEYANLVSGNLELKTKPFIGNTTIRFHGEDPDGTQYDFYAELPYEDLSSYEVLLWLDDWGLRPVHHIALRPTGNILCAVIITPPQPDTQWKYLGRLTGTPFIGDGKIYYATGT